MSPSLWVLLLMFVLGAALTWFAMVRTVKRTVGVERAATGPATRVATYRADAEPRVVGETVGDETHDTNRRDHR